MRKGILVMGAESSGNRYMLRLLISMGCDGNAQPPYTDVQPRDGKPFVWLRSVPYAQEVPNLTRWIKDAQGYSDQVTAVVMLRDMYPSLMSQVKIGHAVDVGNARQRTIGALLTIFRTLDQTRIPFVTVTYSGLVNHAPFVVKWMCAELGLSHPKTVEEAYDGDGPWWQEREAAIS